MKNTAAPTALAFLHAAVVHVSQQSATALTAAGPIYIGEPPLGLGAALGLFFALPFPLLFASSISRFSFMIAFWAAICFETCGLSKKQ